MKNFFIPTNVPSSKNSKNIITLRDGSKRIVHSKLVQKYIAETKKNYLLCKKEFLDYITENKLCKPYIIGLTFYRDQKRNFDYINAAQIVQDLMVKYEWIQDDNNLEIIPLFLPYSYDKEDSGVVISIFSSKEHEQIKLFLKNIKINNGK
jgi:hypothetical protein